MNKKQAIAYAQVTLNYMQSSKYDGEINPITLGIEMKQAYRYYSQKLIVDTANAQVKAIKDLKKEAIYKRFDI